MFAGATFAGFPFAGIFTPSVSVRPRRGGGIGGSGMSDAEYRRLLRRLGALPEEISEDEAVNAVAALRELGVL